jgi:hypothetical protein
MILFDDVITHFVVQTVDALFKGPGRHLPAVARVSCRRLAISLFGSPAAAAKTMCTRVTSAAGIERERAIEASCNCSASLTVNSTFGRPIGMLVSLVPSIPTSYANIVPLTTEHKIDATRVERSRPRQLKQADRFLRIAR